MISPRTAVVVMAKAPRAGAVKTRLCPPLVPREAAALARGFLRDTLARVRRLGGAIPLLAYTPTSERPLFERLAPGVALVPQADGDLGARLREALAAGLRTCPAAIALGTDIPALPGAVLERAIERITSRAVDVVLGPAEDGGYYLIGVRADHPVLFADLPWSTPAVFDLTRGRIETAGLRCALLPPWFDVDTPEDLVRLRALLRESPDAAPATSRFLVRHDACRRRSDARR
jgi:rSAM/selenodomain-associated transferase 1